MGVAGVHSFSVRVLRGCLAGFVCLVLVAAAVGPANAAASVQSPTSNVLNIGVLQTVDSLNPYRGFSDTSYLLYGLLYDYLFSFDQDGNYVPNLAVVAMPSANLTQWTYEVRQGVVWSDGTTLTADDVAFTINYDSQNLNYLWAYEPYFNQVVQCTPSTLGHCGAVVSSPWNVTVFFQRPFVAGKALFAPIVQKAQWSGVSPNAAETTYTNANPIGTGPFIADPNLYNEWLNMPVQPLHLYRNPSYHPVGTHTGPANLTDIYLYVFADPTTLTVALESGTIDLAQTNAAAASAVQGYPNVEVQRALHVTQAFNEIGITQIDTSTANNRLNPARFDARVRQAMARATNKDYIVNQFYNGDGVRGTSLLSPITPQWWYDPVAAGDNLTFDVATANAVLDADGWTGTWSDASGVYRLNPNPITVSYQTACYQCANPPNVTKTIPAGTHLAFVLAVRPASQFPEEYATAQYLQAQYRQIGIEITIKLETTESALSTDVYNGNVEMYIWFWSSDPDPNYILSMESSWTLDGWNDNYWNNATYNAYYLKQLTDADLNQRIADVHAAQRINYESAAYIVYVYPYGEWGMRTDRFQNWGDWAAHPYRQMNTFWGANPMFLELGAGTGPNHPPSTPVISGTPPLWVQPHRLVSLTGSSTDPDPNEILTWTWDWGDNSITIVTTTSATTNVTTDHMWTTPGVYTVLLTVSDGLLSAQSAGFQVDVQGVALPPAYGRPGATTYLSASIVEPTKGKWSVTFGDGSSTSGAFPADGTVFSVAHAYAAEGTYTATLTAKVGSTAMSAQARVVIDGTPPVIQAPSSLVVNATGSLTPVFYDVTATDNVGLAFNVTCSPVSGSLLPLGTTTVSCYVMDLSGNWATASFPVTVRDDTAPLIFVPSLVVAEATSPAGAYVNFSVNATDNVGIASGPNCTPSSGGLFPIGSTSVLCSATDTSGNLGLATFTVRVQDTTPPSNVFGAATDGNGYSVYLYGRTPSTAMTLVFGAYDAVGVVGFVCSVDNATFSSCTSPFVVTGLIAGVHMLSFAGVDAAGNFAPVTFVWTVLSPAQTVQDLSGQVTALQVGGNLTARQASALLTPLSKAYTDLQAGKVSFAIKELKSFRSLVAGYVSSGILSYSVALPLLNESADLIYVLGGTP